MLISWTGISSDRLTAIRALRVAFEFSSKRLRENLERLELTLIDFNTRIGETERKDADAKH